MTEHRIESGYKKEMINLTGKLESLRNILSNLESVLIAFSGGVDSTFLLRVASEVLKENIVAVTASSEIFPSSECDEARRIAESLGVKHIVIVTNELDNPDFTSNPPDRCYHCKKGLFVELSERAKELGLAHIIEGSNFSDINDYRPGMKAVKEFNVRTPLKEAGLTKAEIRTLSKGMNLPTWNKPASPCLSSRIPYGSEITREKLQRIELGERFLRGFGIKTLRVRDHDDIARIETPRDSMHMLLDSVRADEIVGRFRSLGYVYVAIDLQGYRTGSMNEALKSKENE